MGLARTPRVAVRRFLRKEVGYACPICGDPLLTYHHIVPWSEEEHFRTADMIALCYRHAREADSGTICRRDLRQLKKTQLSPKTGTIGHKFTIFDWRDFSLFLANRTVLFTNCFIVLRVIDRNVIWFVPSEHGLLFSLAINDEAGKPLLLIEDNDWLINVEDRWDCEVTSNTLSVFSSDRRQYVKFRLSSEQSEIEMDFAMVFNGFICKAGREGLQLGNYVFQNFQFKNMDIACRIWKKEDDTWAYALGGKIPLHQ